MELLCTNCGYDIDSQTANVQTNLVRCPSCHHIHKVDKLLDAQQTIDNLRTLEYAEKEPSDNRIFENNRYDIRSISNNFRPPPKNSRIEVVDSITSLEISISARGFKTEDIFKGIFTLFWLGFIFVWTGLAIWGGAAFFALFSIPFWLVGFGMAYGLFKNLGEKQILELDRYTLILTKQRLLSKKIYEIDVEDIQSIGHLKPTIINSFKNIQFSNNNSRQQKNQLPTISTKNRNITFLESLSNAEQDWGIQMLKEGIMKFSERNV